MVIYVEKESRAVFLQLLVCVFSPGVMPRHVRPVAVCSCAPCGASLADLHCSGARFHSQCKKEQHKRRETTETQRNSLLIDALGLEIRCLLFNEGIGICTVSQSRHWQAAASFLRLSLFCCVVRRRSDFAEAASRRVQ